MKSHSCTDHTPSGHDSAPTAAAQAPIPTELLQTAMSVAPAFNAGSSTTHSAFRYCAHVTAAGRHCRMLAMVDSELCDHHYRAQAKRLNQQARVEKSMTDLVVRMPRFEDPASVHHFIGDVVKQFAAKQISRHDALAMGYLCQLLLTSFADHRKWRTRRR
jgi:hypothetical protein